MTLLPATNTLITISPGAGVGMGRSWIVVWSSGKGWTMTSFIVLGRELTRVWCWLQWTTDSKGRYDIALNEEKMNWKGVSVLIYWREKRIGCLRIVNSQREADAIMLIPNALTGQDLA